MAARVAGVHLALVTAVAVAVGVAAVAPLATDGTPTVGVALAVTVDGDRVVLTNRAGGTLDVRAVDVRIRVDGTPLRYQPPVPFFAAQGFEGGPTGPFNAAADPAWERGERAGVSVAGTNRPTVDPGDRVTVELRADGRRLATVTATA
jgi:hypothetical protein